MSNGTGTKSTEKNGWNEWSRWVRLGIERLEKDFGEHRREVWEAVNKLNVDMAVIKVKIALWTFLGAALATGAINLIFLFLRQKHGG